MSKIMTKQTIFALGILAILLGGVITLGVSPKTPAQTSFVHGSAALAASFEDLSQNGNSSCSGDFKDSIMIMSDEAHLKGSCCSPMSVHRYNEQVEGLKKFKEVGGQKIAEIPDNPYDIEVRLAKKLIGYYDLALTPEEQRAYDYAMLNSHEKGPCCCKCWRWYVYGGLGKHLLKHYNFTGEQLTKLWNLSDGCGGDNEHHH